MARIVCIDIGTVRPGSEIDDIVGYYDDDVELTGAGYKNFKIYEVKNVTAEEVRTKFDALIPEMKRAYQTDVDKLTWTHVRPKDIWTWTNSSGKWCELVTETKHALTMKDLTLQDKDDLASADVTGADTLLVLEKCTEKLHLDEKNNIEIGDLN